MVALDVPNILLVILGDHDIDLVQVLGYEEATGFLSVGDVAEVDGQSQLDYSPIFSSRRRQMAPSILS